MKCIWPNLLGFADLLEAVYWNVLTLI